MSSGTKDNVLFDFLTHDDAVALRGTVTVRPGEMILDLPRRGEDGPYTISGKQVDSYYEGTNTRFDSARVTAHWATIGARFIGVWQEEGYEWYFSFTLS